MDPMTRLFIQMAQWLRNPPSRSYLYILAIVIAVAVSLALVERYVGWPDWARSEPVPIRHR
jgi:hypothetical protein